MNIDLEKLGLIETIEQLKEELERSYGTIEQMKKDHESAMKKLFDECETMTDEGFGEAYEMILDLQNQLQVALERQRLASTFYDKFDVD